MKHEKVNKDRKIKQIDSVMIIWFKHFFFGWITEDQRSSAGKVGEEWP